MAMLDLLERDQNAPYGDSEQFDELSRESRLHSYVMARL
jgi:hypothetical protein